MMSNKLKKCITNINAISLRILRVDFTGNPATTLLFHNSLVESNKQTNDKTNEQKNKKYKQMTNIIIVA